ncbi:MAG TPA: ADOP family duplicated permease, partial [Vicinamibacterales bacterium]|nr:ADOP family duplicated permease [Vicinamibacterales bacterium]
MDTLRQDVRYGTRQLFRQRGSSLVAVVTLALGIGVSTAIFSVIDATMLRPLPYPNPEQLVTVSPEETMPDGKVSRATASMEDMRAWQKSTDVFSFVAGSGSAFRGRIVEGAEPERIQVSHFTEDYLPMHGVTPLMGRNFTREDTEAGAPLVALLGYGYWQSRYGGREDVIGQSVRFDTDVATIIGVLPASFNATTPVTTPLQVAPDMYARRGTGRVSVYARLRPNITIDQARERLTARMERHTLPDGKQTTSAVAMRSRLDGALTQSRPTIKVLAGAVALILLIACVNVAGLLLARGATRQSELAVRASMGAGRGRLIRQLLTESVVLALPGGALGILLAWLSLDAIVANIPLSISSNSPVTLNLKVLGATTALLVPTALLFGLAPAIRLSRVRIGSVLARGGRQRGSALSRRGGQMLIAAEVALAVILVAGAGLMIRSFLRISAVDLGFHARGLTTMEVLPLDRTPGVHQEYYSALLQQVRSMPGMVSAGIVDSIALGGSTTFTSVSVGANSKGTTVFEVTPGYLEAIGATLKAGRLPTDADFASRLPGVVINETAAKAMFDGTAVGRELTRAGSDKTPWTVLGVIQDLRHDGPLATKADPQVFFPLRVEGSDVDKKMMVVMRLSAASPGLPDQLRRVAQGIGPRVLVERIRSGEQLFDANVLTPRRRTVLLSLLGGLGMALALVGVFGMTAFSVTRRTAEIGVRMAFGARPGQVVGTMMRDAALPIVIGALLGVGGALAATRVIESFLFATTATDPFT